MIDPVRMGKCTPCTVSGFDALPREPTLPITSPLTSLPTTTFPRGVPKVGSGWTICGLDWVGCYFVETKHTISYSTRPRIPTVPCPALPYHTAHLPFNAVVLPYHNCPALPCPALPCPSLPPSYGTCIIFNQFKKYYDRVRVNIKLTPIKVRG